MPTQGLLNVVSAPHLGQASTYRAMGSSGASVTARAAAVAEGSKAAAAGDPLITASKAAEAAAALSKAVLSSAAVAAAGHGAVTEQRKMLLSDASVVAATQKLETLGYPVKVGGRWPSGLPYLDLEIKATTASWGTGLQLPLTMVNISALQVRPTTSGRGVGGWSYGHIWGGMQLVGRESRNGLPELTPPHGILLSSAGGCMRLVLPADGNASWLKWRPQVLPPSHCRLW